MLSLRNRFGIPGVISVIALVFAMLGGAYAASNSGGGKATSSAKAKRGPKGPKGATGPAGPAGPQGPAGANGKDGAAGSNGSAGAQGSQGLPGKSVAVANYSGPECPGSEEGATVEVAGEPLTKKYVCDGVEGSEGPEGSPWTLGGTLPTGKTLTGTWVVPSQVTEGKKGYFNISFNIPLATPIGLDNADYIEKEGNELVFNGSTFEIEALASHPGCPGTAVEPKALAGHLCIYTAREEGLKNLPEEAGIFGAKAGGFFQLGTIFKGTVAESGAAEEIFGASKGGAVVKVAAPAGKGGAFAWGTWAVTG